MAFAVDHHLNLLYCILRCDCHTVINDFRLAEDEVKSNSTDKFLVAPSETVTHAWNFNFNTACFLNFAHLLAVESYGLVFKPRSFWETSLLCLSDGEITFGEKFARQNSEQNEHKCKNPARAKTRAGGSAGEVATELH